MRCILFALLSVQYLKKLLSIINNCAVFIYDGKFCNASLAVISKILISALLNAHKTDVEGTQNKHMASVFVLYLYFIDTTIFPLYCGMLCFLQ